MKSVTIFVFLGVVTIATAGVLVGAPEEQSANDKKLQRMANFAVGEIGSEYELVRVVSGTTQVSG